MLFLKKIQNEKIAVLDDSRLELSIFSNIFKLNKIKNASYYSDPSEFLKKADNYSIYFVDMVLPGYSGEEIIMQLRQRNKNCVIIVVSGISNFKIVSHAMMHGADDYITKPFDNAVLMARLKANARSYFLYKEIEKMAVTDSLTGLYNHKYICDQIYNLAGSPDRDKIRFSIMLLDIDHFKSVNDTYGHQMGDIVLTAISDQLEEDFPSKAVCGRYGGEEFLVVFPDKNLIMLLKLQKVSEKEYIKRKFGESGFSITVSAGVAEFKGENGTDLIKKADDYLYKAKKNGRNKVVSE